MADRESAGLESGCALIVEADRLIGIITSRDLLQLMANGVDARQTPLAAVMSQPVLSLQRQQFTDLISTIQRMRRQRIRHLPIVDEHNQPLGVVTLSSLRRQLKQASFLRFRQAAEVMSADVVSITPQTTLAEVIAVMSHHAISCVVVAETRPAGLSQPGSTRARFPLGLITEQDILQLRQLDPNGSQWSAGQLLGAPPTCVAAEESLSRVHALMSERHLGHVLVVNEQGAMEGIISETDVTDTVDPMQTYAINQILKKQVERLRQERDQLLAERPLDLEAAIAAGELRLVYQPLLALHGGAIFSAEALVRWSSPSQGNIAPSLFIPVAEQSGAIHNLGDWVLSSACRQLLQWRQAGIAPASLSINVSAQQINQPGFVERTLAIVQQHGIEPAAIHLELTDTALVDNFSLTSAVLSKLQRQGFKLAIDDFGSGYASLAYIQHFNVDILKLDQSFIHNLSQRPRNQAILGAVVQLARQLNYELVVEGVESEAELSCLNAMGFPLNLQGYAISPPLEAEAWSSFVATQPVTPMLQLLQGNGRAASSTASAGIHIASP